MFTKNHIQQKGLWVFKTRTANASGLPHMCRTKASCEVCVCVCVCVCVPPNMLTTQIFQRDNINSPHIHILAHIHISTHTYQHTYISAYIHISTYTYQHTLHISIPYISAHIHISIPSTLSLCALRASS